MRIFVMIRFLFLIGAITGWMIEVIFRKFFSNGNPEHKWINPGYCLGPWLPLYGFGLIGLYCLSSISFNIFKSKLLNGLSIFMVMAIAMTVIEFIAGEFCIRILKVKLWNYDNDFGNIDGVICPLFSFFWGVLGIVYLFLVHPYITRWVIWLEGNSIYSFFIGMLYGIFIVDLVYSSNAIGKLKKMAKENEIIIELDWLRQELAKKRKELELKPHFFLTYNSHLPLHEFLEELYNRKEK